MKNFILLFILILPISGQAQSIDTAMYYEYSFYTGSVFDEAALMTLSSGGEISYKGKSIDTNIAVCNAIIELTIKRDSIEQERFINNYNAYVIKCPDGSIMANTTSSTAYKAIQKHESINDHKWPYYHARGYKCIYIFIGQYKNIPK